METIDLINLRNFARRTGQQTHPELLDARPLEHVNRIEIDEEHITIEFNASGSTNTTTTRHS
jgi:hypothetical protein